MSYKARLNRAINAAARVVLHSADLQAAHALAAIKAKATTYIANNPQPRAVFH